MHMHPILLCRLHSCSDYHVLDVCANCGLLISTLNVPQAASGAPPPPLQPPLQPQQPHNSSICGMPLACVYGGLPLQRCRCPRSLIPPRRPCP